MGKHEFLTWHHCVQGFWKQVCPPAMGVLRERVFRNLKKNLALAQDPI